jgi:hypothetical protein
LLPIKTPPERNSCSVSGQDNVVELYKTRVMLSQARTGMAV